MFGRRKPKKPGKLKYTYGRTPPQNIGAKRRRRKPIFGEITPGFGRKLKITVGTLIFLSTLSYLTYFVFFSSYFTFEKVEVIQEGMVEKSTIFNPYFMEAKGKNLVLVNIEEIRAKILEAHPEFDNLSIAKVYPGTIKIEASKYPVIANVINVVGEEQFKHIVNQVGLSVQQNTENPNLKYIKIASEEPLSTESPLLSEEKLMYIIGAIGYFEDKFGMKVFDAEYLKEAREVHLKTEKYFYVWLD
ncbi:hypothetical protein KKG51_01850, partial [Patescibacteria group bacterium]|nr:hypothetical protein [Patescibacteria group bacterium]